MDRIQLSGLAGPKVSQLKALEPGKGKKTNSPEEVKKAAEAFEAYFISSLLKEMRKTVPHQGFLESGPGKEIYDALLDETLATKMSERGGNRVGENACQKIGGSASSFKGTDR